MPEEDKDVAEDTSSDVEEATDSNEDGEEAQEQPEDTEALKAEAEKAKQFARQATARAKKAEEELKALKAKPPINSDPQLSDELKLIARGLSDEEIEQAKIVAKGKAIPLTEAIKDPLFLSYQGDLKERERKEKAKLGASRGSGESQEEIKGTEFGTPREEHMEAFKKLTSQIN
jgi:hypothetical protein